ncbi:hypothetical protein DSCO28_55460 [Desulfosarcina ovata subsp. sediminis]|uniref:Uncharacterized protein n=2 Tax=Desulfosarcina ovata TaxID=83564 RepID=A0A5K7ZXZ9_9BACT|nr:hypothetical protein DSCO28_55460 [Desulfosarcina ovata subsp. sediminis]
MDSDPKRLIDDPGPTYRGFRLQSLYALKRILESETGSNFQPEGIEDLAIYSSDGELLEAIQVKAYSAALSASSLGKPFFLRIKNLVKRNKGVSVTVVSYGPIGPELAAALEEHSVSARQNLISYIARIVDDKGSATGIVDALRLEQVAESSVTSDVTDALAAMCTGIAPERALEALWWWIYSAAEHRTLLDRRQIVSRVTSIGQFLAQRAAFHREWHTTVRPIKDISVPNEQRHTLAVEFASGVAVRPEHIALGLDVKREQLLSRIHAVLDESELAIVHGASGQGKTALAYRYSYDYYPEAWRYRVDLIEGDAHARSIALALAGHAEASSAQVLVCIDVQPGDTSWIELAKFLAPCTNVRVLVTLREEDWRRGFAKLFDLDYRDIELILDEREAERIYTRLRSAHDIPHVIDFADAWARFGRQGPLLEFVHFLHSNDTLESRLKSQITNLQDAARSGRIQDQELDLLRLASVATAYEAQVDVQKLAEKANVREPLRILESYESEFFLRLADDKRHIIALHPIRSRFLATFLTDGALLPWASAAKRVLPIISERDFERFLLCAFLYEPESRDAVLEAVNTFQPRRWTGLCGCMRALLWLGTEEYVTENRAVIKDAFARCNKAWSFMLHFDIAGIADITTADMFSGLGEIGTNAAEAARGFAARQTDTKRAFDRLDKFMRSRALKPLKPETNREWRSLGEACFWVGHLGIKSAAKEWVNEDLMTEALAAPEIEAFGEACVGVATLWGDRYQRWFDANREEVLARLRSNLRIVQFSESDEETSSEFLLSREERGLLAPGDGGSTTMSLNDLVVSKLQVVHNILPFKERYRSKGIGHRTGFLDPQYDESEKGILKRYLLPRWGPELNHLFGQLGSLSFRVPTWAEFSREVLNFRREVLEMCTELRSAILAHYRSKETVNMLSDHISTERWDSLKATSFCIDYLPKCAVDEWGLDPGSGQKKSLTEGDGNTTYDREKITGGFNKAAQEYTRTLGNFLTQALPVLVRNSVLGKATRQKKRKLLEAQLKEAGFDGVGRHLTMVNFTDFCKALSPFQREIERILGERAETQEHHALALRELPNIPNLCLLWHEFLERPVCTNDASARRSRARHLAELDTQKTLAYLRRQLDKRLAGISRDGAKFRVLDTRARWEDKPTLWITCDVGDPGRLVDVSYTLEKCLRKALASCRSNDGHRLVADLNWRQIVAVPLVMGKSPRKLAYPYFWGAVYSSSSADQSAYRHVPLPISTATWRQLALKQWETPRLQEFREFADAIARLWEQCGHFADFMRFGDDLDDFGVGIAQSYIRELQHDLNAVLQNVLDRCGQICEGFSNLSGEEMRDRPMLVECFSILTELESKLLPRSEWSGCESVGLQELAAWHGKLTEALGIVGIAEILWTADSLNLTCDIQRLEKALSQFDEEAWRTA